MLWKPESAVLTSLQCSKVHSYHRWFNAQRLTYPDFTLSACPTAGLSPATTQAVGINTTRASPVLTLVGSVSPGPLKPAVGLVHALQSTYDSTFKTKLDRNMENQLAQEVKIPTTYHHYEFTTWVNSFFVPSQLRLNAYFVRRVYTHIFL